MFNLTEEKRKQLLNTYNKKTEDNQKKRERRTNSESHTWVPMAFTGGALDGGDITNEYKNMRTY